MLLSPVTFTWTANASLTCGHIIQVIKSCSMLTVAVFAGFKCSIFAPSDADVHCHLHLIHIVCRLSLNLSDSSTAAPTQTTVNKKGKSRTLDKDGRNKNRLSHTSAPLFLSKSKRPPQPPELSGATKRMPGGQQQLPRRQRSINTHGIYTYRT